MVLLGPNSIVITLNPKHSVYGLSGYLGFRCFDRAFAGSGLWPTGAVLGGSRDLLRMAISTLLGVITKSKSGYPIQ